MGFITIIADDLTGACDTGIKLVNQGLDVRVVINSDYMSEVDVTDIEILAINTETRSVKPKEAEEKVRTTIEQIKRKHPNWIYKKVDSILRGNIGIELEVMLQELAYDIVVLAPAFPTNHRQIIDGNLIVHNQGLDLVIPVMEIIHKTTNLPSEHIGIDLVRKGVEALTSQIEQSSSDGNKIILMDSVDVGDLKTIASAIHQSRLKILPAGSAGLFDEFYDSMKQMLQNKKSEVNTSRIHCTNQRLMTIVGTNHPVTSSQLQYLLAQYQHDTSPCEAIICIIDFDLWQQLGEDEMMQRILDDFQSRHQKNQNGDVILAASTLMQQNEVQAYQPDEEQNNPIIAQIIAKVAKKIIRLHHPKGLVITGGYTANAVLDCLEIKTLELLAEPSPGSVVSYTEFEHRTLLIATKSGGFGNQNGLIELIEFMKEPKKEGSLCLR